MILIIISKLNMDNKIPNIGDFSFIKSDFQRIYIEDAWETIHRVDNAIEYIKNKDSSEPWIFTQNEMALTIYHSLKLKDGHSGCSIALVMRSMEYIIKNGWKSYYKRYTSII